MKKHLFGMALMTCLMVLGSIASAQTIDEIQVYLPDGTPNSPYDGQTVTITGVVVERGQYSGGSHSVQGATGGITLYTTGSPAVLGNEYSVTGTVGSFGGEIQLGNCTFSLISTGNDINDATPLTIAEILLGVGGEDGYENVGLLATVIGEVKEINSSSTFTITDGVNDLLVYRDSTTGIDLSAVDVGDTYQVTSPIVTYNGLIEMKPRFQTDLVENPGGDTLPTISQLDCDNWVPMGSDPIEISATIADDNGVTSASLYYRTSDGEGTTGTWVSVAMSNTGGDTWAGTIPGNLGSALVEFYLEATDTGAQTVTFPGDAPASWETLALGITPIYAMQYAHPDSTNQDCAYSGKYLNIRGVVTAGTGQAGALSKFIVQEQNVNPETNSYAFGAVLVYEGSASNEVFQGDLVEIGGTGDDYFGLSEMIPHNGNAVNLVDFGQDLPMASVVSTRVLSDDNFQDGDGPEGEPWESVWVKTFPSAVMDTTGFDAFGEFFISTNVADTLIVDPVVELSYIPTIGEVITVEGYMDYAFGNFQIRPLADEFIIQTGLSAADDTPTVVAAGGFQGIAPNPFNPVTKISFVVNKDNMVQLNIYNIRGEKVRTLVQDRLPQMEYELTWDGTNDAGQSVASGAYFARLRIGTEVTQVRKMSLVK
jgi:hypothetical protein